MIKKLMLSLLLVCSMCVNINAQQRRPVDSQHPMWLIHVDVWNKADPQKIIDLIPDDIKPFVVLNLSLSCQYDTEKNVYKMPQNAVKTYKSWGSVCQHNGMFFTCQPASGGHTHIQDDDLETFEYFYKRFPNFLGWNYAEQFWGFDEAGDKSSSSQASRIALFANLVPMAHKYGGFLTVSFCGNIWSHPLNPLGMMKRNASLRKACEQYPEAMLWLYKYTTSSCFYNNESVVFGPFIGGLAKNYGVRYDNCGWNGALDALLGEKHGKKYPIAAGIGTVMEQTCVNGGAVWDGPELIWTEDFQNLSNTTVDGYTRRNWGTFSSFDNAWIDMFRQIIDGTMYIPTREEVVQKTKIAVINNVTSGSDEDKYAAWGSLYDNLYKVTDPFNTGNGQWMSNYSYFKSTGRYGAIPVALELYDSLAKTIPVKVNKSAQATRWSTTTKKKTEFDKYYPEVSTGDLYVNRFHNQLVTYTPYSYCNSKKVASAQIPLLYNTCDSLYLDYYLLSSGIVHEYADRVELYLNNFRSDTTTVRTDKVTLVGTTAEPTYKFTKLGKSTQTPSATKTYDAETGRFTLSIKHNGPVDVVINCQGAGTDRLTDYVPNTALTADLPVQPATYHGAITIEAEDMDYKSITSCVTDPYGWYPSVRGHAGNGFADMGSNTAGSLRHQLKLDEAGTYVISVRYTNTHKAANATLKMNTTSKAVKFDKTATNEWKRVSFEAAMKAGTNTFTLTNNSGIKMYVDNITYRPIDVEDEKYGITLRQTTGGVAVADVDSTAEGELVTLTAVPDAGFRLSGWRIIHGNITISQDNTFNMPDDNVTLQPIFEDLTVVYQLNLTDAQNGGIPTGWRCVQENDEEHAYPTTYSSGARIMKGFTGYEQAGLYWREKYCEYGKQTAYPLQLEPGNYKLTYAMAAWKSVPYYKAQILDINGSVVATSTASGKVNTLASPNANGSTSATLSTAKKYEFPFTITEAGKYLIRFSNYEDKDNLQEFLLLACKLNTVPEETGIAPHMAATSTQDAQPGLYNLMGQKIPSAQRGINIIRTADGRTYKVLKK